MPRPENDVVTVPEAALDALLRLLLGDLETHPVGSLDVDARAVGSRR